MAYRDDKMQDTDREEKTNGVDGGMTFVCRDCPRSCGAARNLLSGSGFCGAGTEAAVAKVMTHMWEEPCISGINGAGNIFFAGCSLHCIYCQNEKSAAHVLLPYINPTAQVSCAGFLLKSRNLTFIM